MRTLTQVLVTLWVLMADGLPPAGAWNDIGHQVVAIIAWDNLSEPARKKAVATMRQAPGDARLASTFRPDGRPLVVREREFFIRASTWPDAIRGLAAYDQPTWHYRDFFWRRENGQIVNLPDASPTPGELLDQLQRIKAVLATNDSAQAGARAVSVAWMLHLIGDMHQPLHCSARVTDQEPRGDGGGNTFKLGMIWNADHSQMIRDTLHKYWDGAIDKAVPRQANEGTSTYLARAAKAVVTAHPKASMVNRLKPGQFEEWCRESVGAAQATAYPPGLKRMENPPGAYRVQVAKAAMERVALGGYRLATTLEERFGP